MRFNGIGRDPKTLVISKEDIDGAYLFKDGSIGKIVEVPDMVEFLDDYLKEPIDWDEVPFGSKRADELLTEQLGGVPEGSMYIDRYRKDGKFEQGGCWWYYRDETIKDYCDRNAEPYPVLRLSREIYDAIDEKDIKTLRKHAKRYSFLKPFIKARAC